METVRRQNNWETFQHSPDSHNDQAPESTVTRREELGGLHEGAEHDNPNAVCLRHLDSDPEQLGGNSMENTSA